MGGSIKEIMSPGDLDFIHSVIDHRVRGLSRQNNYQHWERERSFAGEFIAVNGDQE